MTEAHLLAELQETKAALKRLRERVSAGTHTVHKDLSLVSLVPKWSGSESGIPLEVFLQYRGCNPSRVVGGSWPFNVAVLRLTDSAKQFYNGCLELHSPDADWQKFKTVFRNRYRDTHTDQYHLLKLQTARQGRNETPSEFTDRCQALSQKIICKVADPLV